MTETSNDGAITAHEIRALWEQAQWRGLSEIVMNDIAQLEERAELALLLLAARFHFGDKIGSATMMRQALDWGASQRDVEDMLFAGIENSFGRLAMILDRPAVAERHFQAGVAPLYSGYSRERAAFVRHFHELLNCGLLPDAAQALSHVASDEKVRRDQPESWLKVVDAKIEQMNHGLTLSLRRGQLDMSASEERDSSIDDPETFAEAHSVAQLKQDVWVLERTGFKRGGYFVEFGATNGILLSNSFLLETAFGWKGICAEPNPAYFAQLEKNRNCIVSQDCIGAETGTSVRFVAADEFGGFAEHIDVDMHAEKRRAFEKIGKVLDLTTVSLNDFLKKHGAPKVIDYLSIDTEGSEYDILAAFPFEDWTIRFITVEHNFTPAREKIAELLKAQGYERTEAKWDDWYSLAGSEAD